MRWSGLLVLGLLFELSHLPLNCQKTIQGNRGTNMRLVRYLSMASINKTGNRPYEWLPRIVKILRFSHPLIRSWLLPLIEKQA